MQKVIEKILEDVDDDIKDFFLEDSDQRRPNSPGYYKNWEFLSDPVMTIIQWQLMRNV